MDKNCGIYAIINQVNGKIYVGSSKDLKHRKQSHFSSLALGNHKNEYLQRSFNKYGKQFFEFKVLEYCKEKNLLKREQFYIDRYNSTNYSCGYNMMLKATKIVMSDEQKEKISKGRKGIIFSPKTLKRMSDARKGKAPWNKGKKMTEEYCNNNSKCHIGIKQSEETKNKRGIYKKRYNDLAIEWQELRNQGHSLKKISSQYGVAIQTIALYAPERKTRKKYSSLLPEWRELKNQGWSYNAIGMKYNIVHGTIRNYLIREMGINE